MRQKEAKQAFRYLREHEFFKEIDETNEEVFWCFIFEEEYSYWIKIPRNDEGEIEWYFYKSRNRHMYSNQGASLEETEPWFEELVLRTQKVYETALKNIVKKNGEKVPIKEFEFLKDEHFFDGTYEVVKKYVRFTYQDEDQNIHEIDIPFDTEGEVNWYYFESKVGKALTSFKSEISKTPSWFRELVEKAEITFSKLQLERAK